MVAFSVAASLSLWPWINYKLKGQAQIARGPLQSSYHGIPNGRPLNTLCTR